MTFTRNYIYTPVSPSTNGELKEKIYSSGCPVFDVLSADSQTDGRGRLGRSFFSPSGGVYFSAAYPLSGTEKNIPFLTLLAGLAVSRAINELTKADVMIKWPNDIYLNGKKLCGILTELVTAKSGLHAVVGVGINVKTTVFPEELKGKMTSLAAERLPVPDSDALIKRCVEILDGLVYENDLLNAEDPQIITELEEKSFLRGKKVICNERAGICGSMNPDGSINILFGDTTEKISSGEVSLSF